MDSNNQAASSNVDGGTDGEAPETFGMGDTLASGSSQAIAIKGGRNKHGKGTRKAQQLAISPMKDESKQLVALATAKAKRTRRPRNGPRDVRGLPKKGTCISFSSFSVLTCRLTIFTQNLFFLNELLFC